MGWVSVVEWVTNLRWESLWYIGRLRSVSIDYGGSTVLVGDSYWKKQNKFCLRIEIERLLRKTKTTAVSDMYFIRLWGLLCVRVSVGGSRSKTHVICGCGKRSDSISFFFAVQNDSLIQSCTKKASKTRWYSY